MKISVYNAALPTKASGLGVLDLKNQRQHYTELLEFNLN